MPLSTAQSHAVAHIDAIKADLSAWTATIFDYGETAWREYRSVEWYVKKLREEGFGVEEGSAGGAPPSRRAPRRPRARRP